MKQQAVMEMILPGPFPLLGNSLLQTQLMLSQGGMMFILCSLHSLHGLPHGGTTVATLGWGRRPVSYLTSCCDQIPTFLCSIPAQIALFSGTKGGVGKGSSHGLPLKHPEVLSWCACMSPSPMK